MQSKPLSRFLQAILILSGWAVAVLLVLRESPTPAPGTPITAAKPKRLSPAEKIDGLFQSWLTHPELEAASIGFCIFDESGQLIFASPLAGTGLCPASAFKTLTTGAAFGLLGPDFHFETLLTSTSPLSPEGNVEGDLILVGSGDPTLEQEDLASLADKAVAAGLKHVSGHLLIDASIFPERAMSDFWDWGDIGNAYGAGAYGVNVDHNTVTITFEPGAEAGAPAKFVSGEPVPHDVQWINHVLTGAAGSGDQVTIYSEPYGRTITMRGTVPMDKKEFTVRGANPDPPAFAAEVLRARLEAAGIKFDGRPGPFPTDKKTTLCSHLSEALPEIIDHLHRVSDNLEAQCFFLTLGLQQDADPADAIEDYWAKAGIEFSGLRMLDGSGLARATTIRPIDLARVNFAARHGPNGDRFYQSLSIYENGVIRSKLGAMSGVKTEVGFLRISDKREFTFALMANALRPGTSFWPIGRELLEAIRSLDW